LGEGVWRASLGVIGGRHDGREVVFTPLHEEDSSLEVDPDHDPLDLLGPLWPSDPNPEFPSHVSPLHLSMPSFFVGALVNAYTLDSHFAEIIAHPSSWPAFERRRTSMEAMFGWLKRGWRTLGVRWQL
jgi:hypothetical protein